jgi:hypothetical protein
MRVLTLAEAALFPAEGPGSASRVDVAEGDDQPKKGTRTLFGSATLCSSFTAAAEAEGRGEVKAGGGNDEKGSRPLYLLFAASPFSLRPLWAPGDFLCSGARIEWVGILGRMRVLALAWCVVLLGGCGQAGRGGIADGTAPMVGKSGGQVSHFVSRHRPGDAARNVAEELYERFGIFTRGGEACGEGPQGQIYDFSGIAGDYFYSSIDISLASGQRFFVYFNWMGEGRTEVEFKSTLPGPQHGAIAGLIREAVSREVRPVVKVADP